MALSFQHIAPLATLLWALALMFPPSVAQASDKVNKVIVVATKDSSELQDLVRGMNASGNLILTQSMNPSSSACEEETIVVAFGEEAASMLAVLCPTLSFITLVSSYRYNAGRKKLNVEATGYYLDQPIAKQVRHAAMNMPSIRSLGILYTDNDMHKGEIEELAKENLRFKVQLVKVGENQVVAQIMRDLYQSVDAVLITGNPDIWSLSDFKTYLVLGMRQGKIMIGGYNYIYMNRGSISAVHTDFFAMGEDIASKIESGAQWDGMGFFKKSKIVTNDLLAARYGIYIGRNK